MWDGLVRGGRTVWECWGDVSGSNRAPSSESLWERELVETSPECSALLCMSDSAQPAELPQ